MTHNRETFNKRSDPASTPTDGTRIVTVQAPRTATPTPSPGLWGVVVTLLDPGVSRRVIYWLADVAEAFYQTPICQFISDGSEVVPVIRGALACAARTLRETPTGQPARNTFAAVLGSSLAGGAVGCAVAYLCRFMPNESVSSMANLAATALAFHGDKTTWMLFNQAAQFRKSAEAETGPDGRWIMRSGYICLEWLVHFLVGAVGGIQTGLALNW